ncbi:MAG: hypothetical protein ABIK98_07050 [Pseudomonadota bacterium]|uniref:Uncharacterized protein n=1 Tax=Candidatus Desulfatibia profunda TaxID=2841695 RepID=A0A8J6TLC9_9BACT|nr:hypothetical protein [Candidatus Desulfatibia profunda]MBL7181241.1 hypothetical protein [Desulfobacterales bacterium]
MHLNYPGERTFRETVPGAKKKGDVWIVSLANSMSLDEADEILSIMADGAPGRKYRKY